MTRATYTGHEVLTFPDYTDMEAGKTLTAEPGVTYDVAPASGRLVPDLPAGWFVPLEGEAPLAEAEPGEQEQEQEQEQETGQDNAEHPDEQQQQEVGQPEQF